MLENVRHENFVKHADSSGGRDIIMNYFASHSMGTFWSFRCKRVEVQCSNADY